MLIPSRNRSENGATAVIFAICALMLFGVAAVAVDLGNAFTRKRDVQAQADLAALAGGSELAGASTVSGDVLDVIADYLTRNQPQDDKLTAYPAPAVTAGQLNDGNPSNGEVTIASGESLTVLSPYARVNFGLAGALGMSSTDVQAKATVGIRSPGAALPFFLPKDCTTGPVTLKDSSHDPKVDTFVPASSNGGDAPQVDSVDPITVAGGVTSPIRVFGKKFSASMEVDFFQASSGDRVPADVASAHAATVVSYLSNDDELTTDLPAGVFNRPGKWYVRVKNSFGYSKSVATFTVGNPVPPPATCGQRATGDFGVLDSPRKLVTQLADASALNMAEGLDHDLAPFDPALLPPPKDDTCNGAGGTPPPGAQNDKDPYMDGNNCVDVKNGMNTDVVTSGIITGGTTAEGPFKGLLHEDTLTGCDRNQMSAERDRLGYPTNDDVLSCFLAPGVTIEKIMGTTIEDQHKQSIDSRIFDSPRFAIVPIIDYPINPKNGFYPIVGFQPLFITDEPPASQYGSSYASSSNGVTIANGKVVALTVVPINPLALPETADASGKTIPWIGSGTKVVQLLN